MLRSYNKMATEAAHLLYNYVNSLDKNNYADGYINGYIDAIAACMELDADAVFADVKNLTKAMFDADVENGDLRAKNRWNSYWA